MEGEGGGGLACKRSRIQPGPANTDFSVTAAVLAQATTSTSSKPETQECHNEVQIGGAEKQSQGPPPLDHGKAGLPNLNQVSEKQASLLTDLQSAERNRGTACVCVLFNYDSKL